LPFFKKLKQNLWQNMLFPVPSFPSIKTKEPSGKDWPNLCAKPSFSPFLSNINDFTDGILSHPIRFFFKL